MKKLIIVSLIVALAAPAAFAQVADGITVGGWGRAAFVPWITRGEYKDANDNTVDAENYFGTGTTFDSLPAIEFTVSGVSDYVGFDLNVTSSFGLAGDDPGANVWVKPFGNDLLKILVGAGVDDTLRGKIGSLNGGFDYFSLPLMGEKNLIFSRFATTTGAIITSVPIEGLFLGVGLDTPKKFLHTSWFTVEDPQGNEVPDNWDDNETAEYVYKHAQIGAGYTIDGVGLARIQFIGGKINYNDDVNPGDLTTVAGLSSILTLAGAMVSDNPRIEGAFAYTGMEGLTLDVGLKFWFPAKAEEGDGTLTATKGFNASLGANYSTGDLGIAARIDTNFASGYTLKTKIMGADVEGKATGPFVLNAHLVPSYDLGFAILGIDLGIGLSSETKVEQKSGGSTSTTENKDNTFDFGLGAFIKKNFANGSIIAGLTYTLPTSGDKDNPAIKQNNYGVFTIPVVLEYSF